MSNSHSNQSKSPQGSQTATTKKWDDSASNYCDYLQSTTNLKKAYSKAGLDEDDVRHVAHNLLQDIGITISDSDLSKGGVFDKELSVYHPKKKKDIPGHKALKGFVKFHCDGYPNLYGINHITGEIFDGMITLELIAQHHPSFSMDQLNDKGWLKPEYVPESYRDKKTAQVDPAVREAYERKKQEQYQQEVARIAEAKKAGIVKAQGAHSAAVGAHEKAVAGGSNIEPHANHLYIQRKYGEDAHQYSPYLKNLISSAYAFTSEKDEVYQLLQPGYNLKTGEMTALQRTMHDSDLIKGVDGKKDFYKRKFNEDGSPILTKKFAASTNANYAATPVFGGMPTDKTLKVGFGEGLTSIAAIALAKNAINSANPQDESYLSCYNASNIPKVMRDAREVSPNAQFIVYADNDYETELNAGQHYAKLAADQYNAIVVSPPLEYLKTGQSDWDDVAKNIGDALTQVAIAKTGNPNAKHDFEEMRQILNTVVEMEELKAINAYNQTATAAIEQANKVIEQRAQAPLPDSVLKKKGSILLLAVQDDNFKQLAIASLNTAPLLTHSSEWSMPPALASILDSIDLDDKPLKALDGNERRQVLRTASATLVEMLTDNKSHDSLGINNKDTLQQLTASGWNRVDDRYIKAFMKTLDDNVVHGRQAASSPQPQYLTDFSQAIVQSFNAQQDQSIQAAPPAAAPIEKTAPAQQAAPAEENQAAPVVKSRPRP